MVQKSLENLTETPCKLDIGVVDSVSTPPNKPEPVRIFMPLPDPRTEDIARLDAQLAIMPLSLRVLVIDLRKGSAIVVSTAMLDELYRYGIETRNLLNQDRVGKGDAYLAWIEERDLSAISLPWNVEQVSVSPEGIISARLRKPS